MSERLPPCPICGRPLEVKFRPFCSARCADVDLGNWFTESYAVPVTEDEDEDGRNDADGAAGQAREPRL